MPDLELYQKLVALAPQFGFQQVGIYGLSCDDDGSINSERFDDWLQRGFNGDMHYMQKHAEQRRTPKLLEPWVKSIIVVRMDYLNQPNEQTIAQLQDPEKAFIARYALGRDYHKLIRNRLNKLAGATEKATRAFTYRPFADSAPILEKQIAAATSLGWQGKNTLILNRGAGSWFFLGILFTDLIVEGESPHNDYCGHCTACIDICPTKAIIAPYVLDARRCIAYLTIEHKGSIAAELRPLIGNRVFGCDDCQLCCPWNKFAQRTIEDDFYPRHRLDTSTLLSLFNWDEATFLKNCEGSAIRRLGHLRWLRNLAIALGNALNDSDVNADTKCSIRQALNSQLHHPSDLVREHVMWALAQSD